MSTLRGSYYNDSDPKVCEWVRELIKARLIPDGEVDCRPIQEVRPHEITGFCHQHFFCGIAGWAYALRLAGWPDDRPVRSGSAPCQPFSQAGKGLAEKDERHLWPAFRDLITFGAATVTFGEQVASALGREWLAGVRADLEALGYAVGAADLCAAGVSAPHPRQRLYWMAYRQEQRRRQGRANQRGRAQGSDSAQERLRPADSGIVSGLADAKHSERRTFAKGRNDFDGNNPGREEATGRDGANSEAGGLADADLSECDRRARGGQQSVCDQDAGDTHGLGNARGERCAEQSGRRLESARPTAASWEPFDVLAFRDGKFRRVEAGTFPLAHGVSGRMGLLRGYGNAIVPQVAAEFIQAAVEALT